MRRKHFGRPRIVWKNNIKMDVTELSLASVCYCERVLLWTCVIASVCYCERVLLWTCGIVKVCYCERVLLRTCVIVNVCYCERVLLWTCVIVNVCYCERVLDSYSPGQDAVVGRWGCGDEPSASIKFGETSDLVSNYFAVVLKTNFILWAQSQVHKALTRFFIISTDGNITYV